MDFSWLTNPSFVLLEALTGLSRGMGIFIAAAGLTLIYGVLRILNFAHGSFYMVAAYLAYTVVTMLVRTPGNFWLALIIAPLALAVIGGVLERFVISKVYKSEHIVQLLLTYGLILVIADIVRMIWGVENKSMELPSFFSGGISIAGALYPAYFLFLLICGAAVAFAIWIFLYRTRVGNLIRASASDSETANALGVNVPFIFTIVFMIGAALAGLGGTLMAPIGVIGLGMDMEIVLFCFIVIIVGGLGSIGGALIAALIIGEVYVFGTLILPSLAEAFLFIIMIVVLLLRPFGLLGVRLVEE